MRLFFSAVAPIASVLLAALPAVAQEPIGETFVVVPEDAEFVSREDVGSTTSVVGYALETLEDGPGTMILSIHRDPATPIPYSEPGGAEPEEFDGMRDLPPPWSRAYILIDRIAGTSFRILEARGCDEGACYALRASVPEEDPSWPNDRLRVLLLQTQVSTPPSR